MPEETFNLTLAVNVFYAVAVVESIIAIFISVWALIEALADRRALETNHINGIMRIIADMNIRSEALRALTQFVLFLVSIALQILPDSVSILVSFHLGLFIVQWLIILNVIMARRDRQRALNYPVIESAAPSDGTVV